MRRILAFMRRILFGLLVTVGSLTVLTILAGVGVFFWFEQQEQSSSLPERFVLEVDLRTFMPLANVQSPADLLGPPALALNDFVRKLRAAEEDPRVQGLLVRLAETGHGFARAQEIRNSIERFSKSGKPTASWADSFGELVPGNEGYYIASATDQIALQPGGYVGLTGIAFELPFFRGLLDKIGIEPAVFRRAEYKTALDMASHDRLSPANAEMMGDLAQNLFDQLVNDIAASRNIDAASVQSAIDQAPLSGDLALESGLIDQLDYWGHFRENFIKDRSDDDQTISLSQYDHMFGSPAKDAEFRIGLISAEGNIIRGSANFAEAIAADSVATLFEDVHSSDADAFIIRIDSGGGSAVASETIAHEIRRLREKDKPVIISMVNAAASGGYWIAVEGDRITAMPGTFTGSIGVIAAKPVLDGLLDTLDVNVETVSKGRFAELWSVSSPLEPEFAQKIDNTVGEVYDRFKDHVASNRDLSAERIEDLARGRVWLGVQAVENGLVDRLGGLNQAIEEALLLAEVSSDASVTIEIFPKEKDWQTFIEELIANPFGIIQSQLETFWKTHVEIGILSSTLPTHIR